MEKLLNQLGENLRGFQPEVPSHMEARVMNAIKKDKKSFWKFSLTYLNVYVVAALAGGCLAAMLFSMGNEVKLSAENTSAAAAVSAPAVIPNISQNSENISNQNGELTSDKSSRSQKKQQSSISLNVKPVGEEVINCGGTPEIPEVSQDHSNSEDEIVKSQISQTTETSIASIPDVNKVEKKPKGKKFMISTFHN
jgi:preprotein translocase subunit SecF